MSPKIMYCEHTLVGGKTHQTIYALMRGQNTTVMGIIDSMKLLLGV